MRLVVNVLILIMLAAGAIAGISWYQADSDALPEEVKPAQQALFQITTRIDREHNLHMAAYPDLAPPLPSPEWFGASGPPTNPFAGIGREWMDIAPEGDLSTDPPDPLLTHPQQAAFWFNPNNLLVRARVPQQLTDVRSSNLYNAVNGTGHQELTNRDYAVVSIGLGVDQAGRPLEPVEETESSNTSDNATDNTGNGHRPSLNQTPGQSHSPETSTSPAQSAPRERQSLLNN